MNGFDRNWILSKNQMHFLYSKSISRRNMNIRKQMTMNASLIRLYVGVQFSFHFDVTSWQSIRIFAKIEPNK